LLTRGNYYMEAKHSLARNWILKARRDLLSAKRLASGRDPYLDTAVYHCQQSAEKVIKGWLVYHDHTFEKTHDLRLLVTMAADVDSAFADWFDAAERISPYSTAYRYPGVIFEPTLEEFRFAYQLAGKLYEMVCSSLPPEISKP
jgi:HEPN domain-containing protein